MQDATASAGGAGDVDNEEALDVFEPGDGCGESDKVQGSREALAEMQVNTSSQVNTRYSHSYNPQFVAASA